jgi:hypothetical protein
MDNSEKFAFVVIAVMATFLTSFEFITWEYKNHIVTGIGAIMFLFILWALVSEVTRRYKVVKVD